MLSGCGNKYGLKASENRDSKATARGSVRFESVGKRHVMYRKLLLLYRFVLLASESFGCSTIYPVHTAWCKRINDVFDIVIVVQYCFLRECVQESLGQSGSPIGRESKL